MEPKEKEIKLENGTTIVFTGNLNKKKLDNLLWSLLQNFEERISAPIPVSKQKTHARHSLKAFKL